MPRRILVTWLGSTDLNRASEGRGAIQDIVTVARDDGSPFTKVVVLDDGAPNKQPLDAQNRETLKQRLAGSGRQLDWRDVSDVPRLEVDSLAAAVCTVLDEVCTGLGRDDSVELGLSSGMWTMTSAMLLACTRFARSFPLWVGRLADTPRQAVERLPAPKGLSWMPTGREATLSVISAEEAAKYQAETATKTKSAGVVTRDAATRRVYDLAERLAPLMDEVVILGPSGSGKETVAELIHYASGRAGQFVPVNCGAIPAELAEAELFGTVAGAGTGVAARPGKLALAHNGTLFLDEIADLPLGLQVKLLRAVEDKAVTPVGASHRVPANFRLVTATHRPLIDMVAAGTFREDLYYRIATHELVLPPLRERGRDDVELLFKFLWKQRLDKAAQPAKADLTAAAWSVLTAYHWPGNVRQLKLVVRRLRFACGDRIIQAEDVSAALASFGSLPTAPPPSLPAASAGVALHPDPQTLAVLALFDRPLPLQGTTVEELKATARELVQTHYLDRCAAIKADAEVGRQLGVTGHAIANWRKGK